MLDIPLFQKVLNSMTKKLSPFIGMQQLWVVLSFSKHEGETTYYLVGGFIFQRYSIGIFRQDINHCQNVLVIIIQRSFFQHLCKISFPQFIAIVSQNTSSRKI